MQNEWSSPSGSRWEPAPQQTVGGVQAARRRGRGEAAAGTAAQRRRPVAAVLLTLVGAGR